MKLALSAVCLLLCIPLLSTASSVLQVSFDELVTRSEFIFEGRVVDQRSEMNASGMIHTYVTFEVMDVVKGTRNSGTVTLRYLGGTVGDLSLNVSDLKLPPTGERGIYFVESVSVPKAHPLYGWDQGHFLVSNDRVLTRGRKPVVGFQPGAGKTNGISEGVASGLSIAESNAPELPVTVTGFKQKVREVLNGR